MVIRDLVVGHIQPAVLLPTEQRDLILLRLDDGGRPREPCVRNDDVYAFVVAEEATGRQVVQFRKVCAAIPTDRQLRELPIVPVVLLVALAELLDVKPCLDRVRCDVQRLVEKLWPERRVFSGHGRIVDHVLRADGVAPARRGCFQHSRIMQVNVTVFQCRRGAEKTKDAVGRVTRDRPAQNFPAVFEMGEQEASGVRTVRRDHDDELVCVRLRRVLQDLILLRAFVGVRFVRDDDVAVKGVLLVRIRGQRIDGDHAAADIAGNRPLGIVVDDAKPLHRIVVRRNLQTSQVVFKKIENLFRLP